MVWGYCLHRLSLVWCLYNPDQRVVGILMDSTRSARHYWTWLFDEDSREFVSVKRRSMEIMWDRERAAGNTQSYAWGQDKKVALWGVSVCSGFILSTSFTFSYLPTFRKLSLDIGMVKKSKHCLVLRHVESLYHGAAKVMSTVRDLQALKPLDTAHQWLQFRAGKPHFRPLHFLMGWEETGI